MFNVGIGEIFAILVVCLLLFGPERLPELARQAGRLLGQFQLLVQGALDQLKEESDLKDLNLPDLRVGSLRAQARDYLRELMDVEGQIAELQRERERLRTALEGQQEQVPFDHDAT
jgi:sec-independent protein translocase protein TatB